MQVFVYKLCTGQIWNYNTTKNTIRSIIQIFNRLLDLVDIYCDEYYWTPRSKTYSGWQQWTRLIFTRSKCPCFFLFPVWEVSVWASNHKFSSSVMSGSFKSMFGVLHRLDLGLTSHPNFFLRKELYDQNPPFSELI